MPRASKGNLKKFIIDTVEESAKHYMDVSGGSDIRDAPEYFINVQIGNAIAEKFPTVGYKLEMPVKEMTEELGTKDICCADDIRIGGRFDVVLTSRKSGKPRHVIEVKRSLKRSALVEDAKRLASLIKKSKNVVRLKSNFLVSVTRKNNTNRSIELQAFIDSRLNELIKELGAKFHVTGLYDEFYLAKDKDKVIVVTIFEITTA